MLGGALAAGLLGAPSLRTTAQGESGIAVFPSHGTVTAMPGTEIAFRGELVTEIGTVEVIGSVSGGHSGILSPHADGLGVSYLPDAPFLPGEAVTVRADVAAGRLGERGSDIPHRDSGPSEPDADPAGN